MQRADRRGDVVVIFWNEDTMPRASFWSPRQSLSKKELTLCKRLEKTGKFFAFLRKHRDRLFPEAFQAELLTMYADKPAGRPPVPPALLAMVTLLQAYERRSDAGAVQDAEMDLRWQLVLGCIGAVEAPFSQGVLVEFRERLIKHNLDKRLIERTVELARETGGFGDRALRAALDSAPLWGAGRVEDTFNLIAHAMLVVSRCAAHVLGLELQDVLREAKLELLKAKSVKAALDIDWSDDEQRHGAVNRLLTEVEQLRKWTDAAIPDTKRGGPLKEALDTLAQVTAQDLEPDPDRGGMRIREGVARDRQISISDPDMRHGRKSKSRVINGYKRHIARDVDHGLILAVDVRPANEPEHEASETMRQACGADVVELHIDRGYLASQWVRDLRAGGGRVVAKSWTYRNRGLFTKADFTFDLDAGTVKCPAGQVVDIEPERPQVRFPAPACDACVLRTRCTRAEAGRGRSVSVHPDEALHQHLRARMKTPAGRAELRKRTVVEHGLARVVRRQGHRARYRGVRKNVFDLRRTAAVENLQLIDQSERSAA